MLMWRRRLQGRSCEGGGEATPWRTFEAASTGRTSVHAHALTHGLVFGLYRVFSVSEVSPLCCCRAGEHSTAQDVLQGLQDLVQRCLAHGANVLLMTLLEIAGPEQGVEQQRRLLNAEIKKYVAGRARESPGGSGAAAADGAAAEAATAPARRAAPAVHLLDLSLLLPYEALDSKLRWELWDDGVHLTTAGYDWMGGVVATALLPLIQAEIGSPTLETGEQERER